MAHSRLLMNIIIIIIIIIIASFVYHLLLRLRLRLQFRSLQNEDRRNREDGTDRDNGGLDPKDNARPVMRDPRWLEVRNREAAAGAPHVDNG